MFKMDGNYPIVKWVYLWRPIAFMEQVYSPPTTWNINFNTAAEQQRHSSQYTLMLFEEAHSFSVFNGIIEFEVCRSAGFIVV